MSDTTPNLSLPYILPSQAQKHVTHNEALRVLDLVAQISVASASMTIPPAEIIEGRRYIVPTGATLAWAGKAGQIAVLEQATWSFLAPDTGWIAWVEDATELRIFDGAAWITPDVSLPSQLDELGIGTSPDPSNKLAVSSTASLFTHAGAGHQIKVNKAATADTASLLFQSNWSGRAEMGLVGDNGFQIKVSNNGSTFNTALKADAVTGAVTLPKPILLPLQTGPVAAPPTDQIAVYGTKKAGTGWLEVTRPSGRNFTLQPSLGLNRTATWAPNSAANVSASGMPRTIIGTTTTPLITTTSLSTSIRRWRHTSAATAASVAEERTVQWVCWRGDAPSLGGFTFIDRLSVGALTADTTGFFGLIGVTTSLAATTTVATLPPCVGIGFTRPGDVNWQILYSAANNTTTKIDLGPAFAVNSLTNVITLIIYAAPNGSSVWIEVVEEVSGTKVVQELTTSIPTPAQLLGPRHFMSNGATAAAVAFECSGVYIETDF